MAKKELNLKSPHAEQDKYSDYGEFVKAKEKKAKKKGK